MTNSREILDSLSATDVYNDYERAFSETTGMPLSLNPAGTWQMPHHGKKHENRFCAMMAEKSRTCAACLCAQEKLMDKAREGSGTVTCEMELCDSAVPVKAGGEMVGFLQTGQVLRKKPTAAQFARISRRLAAWGIDASADLKRAYFQTRVLSPKKYEQAVRLLTIFGQHLSLLSNQLLVRKQNAESPMIGRAKKFIKENQSRDISLGEAARAVNSSTFYFCKMFKKGTSLNFTDYLSRLRIEKAKSLLLNPNLRVSEIAFEVGFQSLTHFNRVFKKIAGDSPTGYRGQLLPVAA